MNAILSVRNKTNKAAKEKGEDIKHLTQNEKIFLFLQFVGPQGSLIFKQIWYQYSFTPILRLDVR